MIIYLVKDNGIHALPIEPEDFQTFLNGEQPYFENRLDAALFAINVLSQRITDLEARNERTN